MPRKTLTALEPVTLPMDASAYWSWIAATLLAKVSEWREDGDTSGLWKLCKFFIHIQLNARLSKMHCYPIILAVLPLGHLKTIILLRI